MKLNKSYRLVRFLNRRHGWLLRVLFGVIAWSAVLVITRSLVLSRGQWREYLRDDFRLACRRSGWYARQFWRRLDVFDDPFFDFTMETTAEERQALLRFVQARRRRDALQSWTDELYIRAADLHQLIEEQGRVKPGVEVVAFYDLCDQVLSALPDPEVVAEEAPGEREADFSLDDARVALRDFAELLPVSHWPWYVISGTFLGLHRDGGFLPHDYDIDVGINAESVSVERLLDVLEGHPNYVVKKVDQHLELKQSETGELQLVKLPSLVKLVHANGLNLDVFIHYTEQGVCWHGSIIHRWENTPFELQRAELEGVEVNAPVNADLYLTENYGDWRTPVKQFDCTTGTPNLVVSRNFLSVALFLKRLSVFRHADAKQADKLERALLASGVISKEATGMKVVREFQVQPPERGGV